MLHELLSGPLFLDPGTLQSLIPQLQRDWQLDGPMLQAPTAERLASFARPLHAELDAEAVQAAGGIRPAGGKIAIIPLEGVLTKRSSWFGMGYRQVGSWLQQAFNDPDVSAIVLQVDSPGGTVDGNEELTRLVATAPKVVVTFVDGLDASAAYRITSQSSGIVVGSPTAARVGSIGTVQQHVDLSKALEQAGQKITFVTADRSTHKMLGNPTEPLSEETLAYMKEGLNAANDAFISDVQAGRGQKLSSKEDVFTGKIYNGNQAVKHGLADSVGTLSDAVRLASRLASSSSSNSSKQTMQKHPILAAALVAAGSLQSADAALEPTEQTLDHAEKALDGLQKQNGTLSEQVQTLTTERDTLQTAKATLETEKTQLGTELAAEKSKVQTLETFKQQAEQNSLGGHQNDQRDGQGKELTGYQKVQAEKVEQLGSRRNLLQ